MAGRKKIGLYFESYRTLPAYVIYIQNLIRTFAMGPPEKLPELTLLHRHDSPLDEVRLLGYPYLNYYQLSDKTPSLLARAWRKYARMAGIKVLARKPRKRFPADLDIIFPYDFSEEASYVKHKLIWKPDFQELHLPQYFTLNELEWSHRHMQQVAASGHPLILSSEDARRDFETFFPGHSNRIFVWRFTSSLPDYGKVGLPQLKAQFGITKKYFLVANQFWPHKNHLNVLKAIENCPDKNFQVVFTGKQSSGRDPELFAKLQHFVELHNIRDRVVFTGFIDRASQLALMDAAEAVIQPSTFEGWSTVIEDCKAMNQYVIASEISVNREQLPGQNFFFDPYDYEDLAKTISAFLSSPRQRKISDYQQRIKEFSAELFTTLDAL